MRGHDEASTDTLSVLPLIACCLISVTVLLSSFAYTGSQAREMEELEAAARSMLESSERTLLREGCDGLPYLVPEWRAETVRLESAEDAGMRYRLIIRIFGAPDTAVSASGDPDLCSLSITLSVQALVVSCGASIPAELVLKVGR